VGRASTAGWLCTLPDQFFHPRAMQVALRKTVIGHSRALPALASRALRFTKSAPREVARPVPVLAKSVAKGDHGRTGGTAAGHKRRRG
jgi:hypothetical protein